MRDKNKRQCLQMQLHPQAHAQGHARVTHDNFVPAFCPRQRAVCGQTGTRQSKTRRPKAATARPGTGSPLGQSWTESHRVASGITRQQLRPAHRTPHGTPQPRGSHTTPRYILWRQRLRTITVGDGTSPVACMMIVLTPMAKDLSNNTDTTHRKC